MTHAARRAAALLLLPSLWLAGTASAEPPAATAAPATAAAAPAPPETVKLEPPPPPAPPTPDDIIASATRIALENGMIIEDLRPGRGAPALPGVNATVYYAGWLYDRSKPDWKGKLFDSALARCPERAGVFSGATSAAQPCRTTPFVFPVGARRVIPGWDIGLIGMKVGGKRRLVIPAKLAYGDRGAGGVIPPGSTLVFEIELLSFFTTTSTTGR